MLVDRRDLAGVLMVAAGLVLGWAVLGRRHHLAWLWRLGAAGVTAAAALRGLLGAIWSIPAVGHLPAGFYWLNLLVYTPLCWVLVVPGWRLLGPRRAGRRRHLPTVRATAVTVPVVLVALLLFGAYGFTLLVAHGYSPNQGLGAVPSRYVETSLARFHYIRAGHGSPVVLLAPGAVPLSAWLPEFRALAADHMVYAVELPGQGFTRLHDDAFAFNLHGMTRAIGVFLNAMHIERTALAGNSWSGGWALAYAQLYPGRVSRLLLLAPSGLNRPDPVGWEIRKLPVIGGTLAQLGAASPSATADQVRAYFVHSDRATPQLVRSVYATNTFPDNFEGGFTRVQSDMRRVTVIDRHDGRVTLLAVSRYGMRARLVGASRSGWCWLQSRFLIIAMAARAEPGGGTRVALTEASASRAEARSSPSAFARSRRARSTQRSGCLRPSSRDHETSGAPWRPRIFMITAEVRES